MRIQDRLHDEVLVLDGAMGTMIQRHGLTEDDFRGTLQLRDDVKYKGCNDLLVLTRPDVISGIHAAYIEAGADIIETNSFNANAISMAEYHLGDRVSEINREAARLARCEADREFERSGRRVYVAGSMGPSNVALSIPAVHEGGVEVDFDTMAEAYREQAEGLIEGGADILLLETIFDTLNAKAAIAGVKVAMSRKNREDIPLMISVTLTEQGRTLSGQTVAAFLDSVRHAGAMSIGLNCGFGAEGMAPWLEQLQSEPAFISLHPNAGLPDELGRYTETPATMAAVMAKYLAAGKLNIAGGCCGTTPDHIRAIAAEARKVSPRPVPAASGADTMHLAGLESCEVNLATTGFLKVGERCNVAGSRKFLRLVNEGNLPEALDVATAQIAKGARVLDINMDDAMLDAPLEMERFVTLLGADAATSPLPLMIDSSDMRVIRRALRKIQGRPIVNSISLKEGEEKFLKHAREIQALGAAVVVMAFDEQGQATTLPRRIEICRRAYDLLTGKCGFKGSDIVFDPNVLTIATGVAEHDRYALDFLDAVSWIKKNLPGAKVSGGVSNLSFSFRGHNKLREAMHTVFLHHAIERGMDMAIVNPSTSLDINSVDATLREAAEDLIFCRRQDATDRMLAIAAEMQAEAERRKAASAGLPPKKPQPHAIPTIESLVEKGIDAGLTELLDEALASTGSAMAVVKTRLMAAMQRVGDEFGAGRMFLPQVVRSAAVMKRAIEHLTPALEAESSVGRENGPGGVFVIATVKGDVHDIGKNIVGVILKCSGYEVIDLGVMVDPAKIVVTVKEHGARFLGLSGLITPSLAEMCVVAEALEREGLTDVVLCVGGATTSDLHTAVKIAPIFSGLTLHTRDAAQLPPLVADAERHDEVAAGVRDAQHRLRHEYEGRQRQREAKESDVRDDAAEYQAAVPMPAPATPGLTDLKVKVADAAPLINWKAFLHTWRLSPALAERALALTADGAVTPAADNDDAALAEACRLIGDARKMIAELEKAGVALDARVVLTKAHRSGDDMVIEAPDGGEIVIPTLRRRMAPCMAMADFLAEDNDWVALFAVTARNMLQSLPLTGDDYHDLLVQSLADRLVEASTEWMHTYEHSHLHALQTPRGIRPAIGYPSMPDQTIVFEADKLLHYSDLGISLTENGALSPSATTTGFIFASPCARYFEVGDVSAAALNEYARKRGMTVERLHEILPRH